LRDARLGEGISVVASFRTCRWTTGLKH